MKSANFPARRALRKAGVKRAKRPPHVADIRFRIGAAERSTDRLTVDAISGRVTDMKTKQQGFALSLPAMLPAVVLAFVAVCYVALGWFAVFGS